MTNLRPLCAAELALARQVFGGALDAARVRIVHEEHLVSSAAALFGRGRQFVVRGDRIFAPPHGALLAPDFCALGPDMIAVLAHELTHVWQYQRGYLTAAEYVLSFNWRYAYALEPRRDFLDYGYEQQASMVEDYVRLTHGLLARHASHAISAAAIKKILPFGLP